jgi:penicillin-binding protein 1A
LSDLFGQGLKTKLKRGLLSFDSFLDSGVFHAARWLREYYERYTAFMDRFHVAGWRRWVLVEPLSEGATLGMRSRSRRSAKPPTTTG